MKHYDKFNNPLCISNTVPTLGMQVAETQCFHCGKTIRFPVPAAYVDWEKIAESYRKRLEETLQDFSQMSNDVELIHGENPAAQYVTNRLRMIVIEIQNKIQDGKRESGA